MKNNRDFQTDDKALPEGWTPELDADPRWRRIAQLASEAGEPPKVPPARFEAMKLDLHRQLKAEGLLRDAPANDGQSFTSWLRSILLGGGLGAQLVRFGAVGALAFMAAQTPDAPPHAPRANPTPVAPGAQPPTSVAQASEPETKNTKTVANNSAKPEPAVEGFAIERGKDAPNYNWTATAPNAGPAMVYNSSAAIPVSAAASAAASGGGVGGARVGVSTGRNLAAEAYDQLQVVKFYSLVQQDDRQLAEIRRVEQLLGQMVGQGKEGTQGTVVPEAQSAYWSGEQLLAAGRYGEALESFDRVAQIAPESILGYLARFQEGRIAFEHTRDYQLATESFRTCLRDYPAHFTNSQNQAFLEEHLQVLDQTASSNWTSLRIWQDAKAAKDPALALTLLVRVIGMSESSTLAVDSADRIREFLLTDYPFTETAIEEALLALDARVARGTTDAATARIQFNRAEITSRRRPGDLSSLAAEYARVLQLSPDENVARAARIRLNLIQSRLAPQR